MKRSVGIYEAKASLSKLIRSVHENRITIQISDRGVPVAQLVPIPSSDTLADRMQELLERGDLIAAADTRKPTIINKKKGALARFFMDRE